jgi:hypothetical protein
MAHNHTTTRTTHTDAHSVGVSEHTSLPFIHTPPCLLPLTHARPFKKSRDDSNPATGRRRKLYVRAVSDECIRKHAWRVGKQ